MPGCSFWHNFMVGMFYNNFICSRSVNIMQKNIRTCLLLSLATFLFSCRSGSEEKEAKIQEAIPIVEDTTKGILINKYGNVYPTAKPLPIKGKEIDPERFQRPKIIQIKGQSKVVPAHTNIDPIVSPKVVSVPSKLTIVRPGRDSIPLPERIPVLSKIVPAIQTPSVPAQSLRMKDAAINNLQYLDIDQGLNSSFIKRMVEDERGHLWFASNGTGLSRYDGNHFNYYTTEEGLSNNFITAMLIDRQGYLWLGTEDGKVTCFDGNNFTHYYVDEPTKRIRVYALMEDNKGNFWIGTQEGVSCFNPTSDPDSLTHFSVEQGLSGRAVLSILQDHNGDYWFGTHDGGVTHYKPDNDQGSFTHYTTEEGLSENKVLSILEDSQGNVWFGTYGSGLNRYTPGEGGTNGSFTHFSMKNRLGHNRVESIFEDSQGNLWFGTYGGGVNRYDPAPNGQLGGSFFNMSTMEGLSNNRVWDILEDHQGKIWFATAGGGVNRYDGNSFKHFSKKDGLSEKFPIPIMEDRFGNLQLGTFGSGISRYDGKTFTHFSDKEGLTGNHVRSIMEDSQGNVWFGTQDNGVSRFNGNSFTNYTTKEGMSNNFVHAMLEDSKGNLWFGTRGGGVNRYKPGSNGEGGRFTHFTVEDGLSQDDILSLMEDPKGNIWIGTNGGGVIRFEPDESGIAGTCTYFTSQEGLGENRVWSIQADSKGNIWFGTFGGGLSRYAQAKGEGENGRFFTYTTKDGLSNNWVWSTFEDKDHNLWISTSNGLTLLKPIPPGSSLPGQSLWGDYQLFTFGRADGLKNAVFNSSSAYLDRNNQIWWGARNGLTMLDLDEYELPKAPPKVSLNTLEIDETFIDYRRLKDASYTQTLSFGKDLLGAFDSIEPFHNYPNDLQLPYQLNHLTFHFTAIDWAGPHKIKYSYMINGLDKDWSIPGASNKADYRNLPPGKHTLRVRAIGAAQIWSDSFEYSFVIHAPWWSSWWAYLLYAIFFFSLVFGVYRFQLKRKLDQAESIRLKELDVVKTRLYTNIAHEFRTPLTIIQGVSDQIQEQVLHLPKEKIADLAHSIQRNGAQLLRLVNQMLDLRKLESGNMPVHWIQGDIIGYLKYIQESFHTFAAAKNIRLHFLSNVDTLPMDYDQDKLLNIISNLLSNAIKFTPEGGDVYLSILKSASSTFEGFQNLQRLEALEIKIKDTGIGIPLEQLPHIFNRFYQVGENTALNGSQTTLRQMNSSVENGTQKARKASTEGTGIGLALTKELVKILGGEIDVKSTLGKGTEFTILLPISNKAVIEEAVNESSRIIFNKMAFSSGSATESEIEILADRKDDHLPLVLIIEDNEDVKTYLTSCLKEDYRLALAANGQEGVDKAIELVPDIIISDVMMPQKNGYEVCESLKVDERTSHIPIILLTAKADLSSKIEGLERGADVYLAKPFNRKELLVHLRKLVEWRKALLERYGSMKPLRPTNDKALQMEDSFLLKLHSAIDKHIEDPDFGVAQLCRVVGISRAQLFRKVKALTGKSTSLFIRTYRLHRAKELLQNEDFNISEVAFQVGFKDLSYFSRSFNQEFGKSPSETRK